MAQPRTPPELIDDAIGEILLRIPPGESAYLVRASRVCKLWRRILSDPDFTRRYREFHPTPPLLGFFHNHYPDGDRRFIPTMAACPFTQSAVDCSRSLTLDDRRRLWAVDCRHGRVLLRHRDTRNLVVWDPITGGREEMLGPRAAPTSLHNSMIWCSARRPAAITATAMVVLSSSSSCATRATRCMAACTHPRLVPGGRRSL